MERLVLRTTVALVGLVAAGVDLTPLPSRAPSDPTSDPTSDSASDEKAATEP